MAYEFITTRTEGEKVGIITLNRPKQLNALSPALMVELGQALKGFDADDAIGCIVITGNEKAFAAGADIGAMATYTFADVYRDDDIARDWETIRSIRKPVIAAVSGFDVAATPYAAGHAGSKAWFIQDYRRPGFTIEAGSGENPLPLSQFPDIWSDNLGILLGGMTAVL